jgi:hypothetical protein
VTIAKNVQHAVRHAKYAGTKGAMMSEPRLEDDIALGLDEEEELDDGYQEPDRMWGDE